MATRTARSVPALLLIVGGVFILFGFVTYFIPMSQGNWNWWTYFISNAALAVAAFLLARSLRRGLAAWALYAAALGWLLIDVWTILSHPASLLTAGHYLGAIGGVVAAIVIVAQRQFPRRASIWFLVAMLLAAMNYFGSFSTVVTLAVSVAYGVVLVVTGYLLRARK